MNYKFLLLLGMIFLHIVDDYYLQAKGCLSFLKQKDWWNENEPNPLYKYDYLMALFMHSFSWTTMIMLIPTIYALYLGICNSFLYTLFLANLYIHMVVDNLKANDKKINLITDQCIHLLQIFVTWSWFIFI